MPAPNLPRDRANAIWWFQMLRRASVIMSPAGGLVIGHTLGNILSENLQMYQLTDELSGADNSQLFNLVANITTSLLLSSVNVFRTQLFAAGLFAGGIYGYNEVSVSLVQQAIVVVLNNFSDDETASTYDTGHRQRSFSA